MEVNMLARDILAKTPRDFWSFRKLYTLNVHLLIVGLLMVPRTTIMYLYLYERETIFFPLLSTTETDIYFWILWLLCPQLLCIHYMLHYYRMNYCIIIAFSALLIEYQMKEMNAIRNIGIARIAWLGSLIYAIVFAMACCILPDIICSLLLYICILAGFFDIAVFFSHIFLYCSDSRITITHKPENVDPPHFPKALNIPTLSNNINIPTVYLCPISKQIMTQPAMTIYGNTYEYGSIVKWLETNSIDPLTKQPMDIQKIYPNRAIRQAIEEWVSEQVKNSNSK